MSALPCRHRTGLPAGTILFSEDDVANALNLVETGELISDQTDGEDDAEWPVQRIGPATP